VATNGHTTTPAAEEAPRPPKPIVVHFFDRSVREIAAIVLHVPDLDVEELAPSPNDDDDADSDLPPEAEILATGRPAVDPACVLEYARKHLETPGCEELCAKLKAAPTGEAERGTGEGGVAAPPLRLLDISRGRIMRVYRSSQRRAGTAGRDSEGDSGGSAPEGGHDPARPQQQSCIWLARGANFFSAALRVEADIDLSTSDVGSDEVVVPRLLPQQQLVEVFHAEHTTGRSFGHPFLLRVAAGERAKKIGERLQAKLCVPSNEINHHWRLVLSDEGSSRDGEAGISRRVVLNDTDEWPLGRSCLPISSDQLCWDPNGPAFCLERPHPAHLSRSPAPARAPRYQKPLTIRAR